jgi:hypothetical protein
MDANEQDGQCGKLVGWWLPSDVNAVFGAIKNFLVVQPSQQFPNLAYGFHMVTFTLVGLHKLLLRQCMLGAPQCRFDQIHIINRQLEHLVILGHLSLFRRVSPMLNIGISSGWRKTAHYPQEKDALRAVTAHFFCAFDVRLARIFTVHLELRNGRKWHNRDLQPRAFLRPDIAG